MRCGLLMSDARVTNFMHSVHVLVLGRRTWKPLHILADWRTALHLRRRKSRLFRHRHDLVRSGNHCDMRDSRNSRRVSIPSTAGVGSRLKNDSGSTNSTSTYSYTRWTWCPKSRGQRRLRQRRTRLGPRSTRPRAGGYTARTSTYLARRYGTRRSIKCVRSRGLPSASCSQCAAGVVVDRADSDTPGRAPPSAIRTLRQAHFGLRGRDL